MADSAYGYEADTDYVHGDDILAGKHKIWVFDMKFPSNPIHFAKDIGSDCFSFLGNPDKTLGAGFSELRWFYDRWLEIMGDQDVSLGFIVFRMCQLPGDIYLPACP